MRKSDAMRVSHKNERGGKRGVKVHHKKKCDGLTPQHERKNDGVRVHHEKNIWGGSSPKKGALR